jgi:hypothetical protein
VRPEPRARHLVSYWNSFYREHNPPLWFLGLGYGGRVFGMFLRRHCEEPAAFLGKEVRNDENGTRTAQMDDDSALDVSVSAVFTALFHRDTT